MFTIMQSVICCFVVTESLIDLIIIISQKAVCVPQERLHGSTTKMSHKPVYLLKFYIFLGDEPENNNKKL